MVRTDLLFFATRADLDEVITAIEALRHLAYIRTGLFDEPTIESVESLLSLPEIGTAQTGSAVQCPAYLVAARPFVPVLRSVPQRRGGTKYAIDQQQNPQAIVIRPGGVLNDTTVIAGSLGTASTDPTSLELFALFRAEFRSRFPAIKSYRVGRAAARVLDGGGRLTADLRSPALDDLARH